MAITKDLGGASYNAFSTEAKPVDTTGVSVVKAAGIVNQGINAFQEKQAVDTLVGQPVNDKEALDIDKALNLRQIKKARDQGILTATQARLKVGQAIRTVAEDYPGREQAMRERAGIFFGKFGEGDLALTKSSEASAQEAIFVQSFLKPGVAAGIIDPNDPFGDKDGQADWQKLTHDATQRKTTRDVIQTQAETGKASGFDAANAYISSDVADDIALGVNNLIKAQKSGQAITDPLEIKSLFTAQKVKHKQVLRNRLSKIRGMTTDQKKQALAEIDNAYKDLDAMIANGSLVKMIEQKQELLTRMATVYGVSKFPQLFAAEKVSPGIGSQLLKIADTLARIRNDATRKVYIDRQPPMVRMFIQQTMDDPMSISKVMSDAMQSNTTSGNEWLDSLFLSSAKDGMHSDIENPDSVTNNFKDQSIAYVLKNAPSIGDFKSINNPSTKPRIVKDPRKLNMLKNKFVAFEQSLVPKAQELFTSGNKPSRVKDAKPLRQVDYTFDFNTKKFTMNLEGTEWPLGHSGEEASTVNGLNDLYETLDYYSTELGIDPIEWVTKTLSRINTKIEQPSDKQKTIEDLIKE